MRKEEVKKILIKNNLSEEGFDKWMSGQTVGINKDGSLDYYDRDVERYINTMRRIFW